MYASPEELEARGSPRLIAELSGAEDGHPRPERILRALADASAEIDAYLAARFCLPLLPPPPVLVRIACDFALYRLFEAARAGDVKEVRQRYDDGIAWLKAVAAGVITPFPAALYRAADAPAEEAGRLGGAAVARRPPIFTGNWGRLA